VTAVLLLVLLTSVAFAGVIVLAPQLMITAQAAPLAVADLEIVAAYEDQLSAIYDEAVDSVVKIDVTVFRSTVNNGSEDSPMPDFSPFTPYSPEDLPLQGQGSGFVWDTQGHIVTNYHVVSGAEEVVVTFADGAQFDAEVVGSDPDADLAVLKVDLPAEDLKPLAIGDSDNLHVGQLTVAIGTPFGQDFTMTSGIVSAIGRTIRSGNGQYSIPTVIQTDASINPGNSGGPLLNRLGEVIGINTQILSRSGSNSGVGFAVPINIASRVVPTLIAGQAYEYSWLGISGNDMNSDIADFLKLPANTRGALVGSVAEGGPAELAGLRGVEQVEQVNGQSFPVGADIIVAINGEAVNGINDVITYLVESTKPGDQITVDVIRADGQRATLDVTLGVRPHDQ
jgi:S1-C subfamily serine protease